MEKLSKKKPEFPGYPMYLPQDDIVNRGQRVERDIEDIITENHAREGHSTTQNNEELELRQSEDAELIKRTTPIDFSGMNLDVPGAELDDQQEEIGNEDEENNFYSLGGDNHEDLEEQRE